MDADVWQALKNEEPASTAWNFQGKRYEWKSATEVSITGTKFPAKHAPFTDVGIVKKSFVGSKSSFKPSFKLDFLKKKHSTNQIEPFIGISLMTLNNCVQDFSYIRQPLGYELFRQAGVPNFRCNFAQVNVNGVSQGVYLNIEPFKEPFLKHIFNNDHGNGYEVTFSNTQKPGERLDAGNISYEGFSAFEDKSDLKLAADAIQNNGIAGVQQVVNVDAFIKFYAMETLLKHWDGYTTQQNNTFIYNDTSVLVAPTLTNIKMKFIPSGIDQMLQPDRAVKLGEKPIMAKLIRADPNMNAKLLAQIGKFANDIFGQQKLDSVVTPLIDKLQKLLIGAGAKPTRNNGFTGGDLVKEIQTVRDQLKSIGPAAVKLSQGK